MLVDKILNLNSPTSYTKHERIIKGVTDCILDEMFEHGDILPSVNELSNGLGYARETVVKAYSELKNRGIISSKKGVGYFIANNDVDQKLSIALVMYSFHNFQQDFYNSLRKALGSRYNIDVFFHHNNKEMYTSVLNNIRGRYGFYVIAPIQNKSLGYLLEEFPSNKLLIVDRYQYAGDDVSHITQEFEISLLSAFEELKSKIFEYKKFYMYFKEDVDYPIGILHAFQKFCQEFEINFEIKSEYEKSDLKKGRLYFTVGDSDLWNLLRDAKKQELIMGKDFGIISHNDSPVKEIYEKGITTFSTDFNAMAVKASGFLKNRKKTKTIIPSKLIQRGSL